MLIPSNYKKSLILFIQKETNWEFRFAHSIIFLLFSDNLASAAVYTQTSDDHFWTTTKLARFFLDNFFRFQWKLFITITTTSSFLSVLNQTWPLFCCLVLFFLFYFCPLQHEVEHVQRSVRCCWGRPQYLCIFSNQWQRAALFWWMSLSPPHFFSFLVVMIITFNLICQPFGLLIFVHSFWPFWLTRMFDFLRCCPSFSIWSHT